MAPSASRSAPITPTVLRAKSERIDIGSNIAGEGGETERDGYRVGVGEVGGGVNRGCSGGGPGNTTDPPLGDTTITIQ